MQRSDRRTIWPLWLTCGVWVVAIAALGVPLVGRVLGSGPRAASREPSGPGGAPTPRASRPPSAPVLPKVEVSSIPLPPGAERGSSSGRLFVQEREHRIALYDKEHPDTPLFEGEGYDALVAPGGRRVAFKRDGPTGTTLFVALVGEDGARLTVEPQAAVSRIDPRGGFSFSPDGERLALTVLSVPADAGSAATPAAGREVYVLDLAGGGHVYRLSEDGGFDPAWLRSGRVIYKRDGPMGAETWIRDGEALQPAHRLSGPDEPIPGASATA